MTTLTTLGASLFPFFGLLSFMMQLWRDPLQFLRARAVLSRPGAALVLDRHVRYSAKEGDVSRAFRAHARTLRESGVLPNPKGQALTEPLVGLLWPDPLYELYGSGKRGDTEAVRGALQQMREDGLLCPLREKSGDA